MRISSICFPSMLCSRDFCFLHNFIPQNPIIMVFLLQPYHSLIVLFQYNFRVKRRCMSGEACFTLPLCSSEAAVCIHTFIFLFVYSILFAPQSLQLWINNTFPFQLISLYQESREWAESRYVTFALINIATSAWRNCVWAYLTNSWQLFLSVPDFSWTKDGSLDNLKKVSCNYQHFDFKG